MIRAVTNDISAAWARFSKWVFRVAAIYGVIVILPDYFLEHAVASPSAPFNYPVYYYGFVGLALAWQVAFFIISIDPQRYRLMMLPAIVDKVGFALPAWFLYMQGRGDSAILPFALIDVVFGILFAASFIAARKEKHYEH